MADEVATHPESRGWIKNPSADTAADSRARSTSTVVDEIIAVKYQRGSCRDLL
jgi:hypothetical protein